MLKILAFITVVIIGGLFGALCGYTLPTPLNHIVSLIGGGAIGWYGFSYATKLIDQHR